MIKNMVLDFHSAGTLMGKEAQATDRVLGQGRGLELWVLAVPAAAS